MSARRTTEASRQSFPELPSPPHARSVTFQDLADWNLSATYVIYAVFALLSTPLVVFCIKETKGKTLEEMG
ncbi:hypothetical protein VR46_34175 [Streptomyces sp. NRRL S-444]|nr:hypothetical protein VR46_34175 [Streptomyces sp. NRRL S-444]